MKKIATFPEACQLTCFVSRMHGDHLMCMVEPLSLFILGINPECPVKADTSKGKDKLRILNSVYAQSPCETGETV